MPLFCKFSLINSNKNLSIFGFEWWETSTFQNELTILMKIRQIVIRIYHWMLIVIHFPGAQSFYGSQNVRAKHFEATLNRSNTDTNITNSTSSTTCNHERYREKLHSITWFTIRSEGWTYLAFSGRLCKTYCLPRSSSGLQCSSKKHL